MLPAALHAYPFSYDHADKQKGSKALSADHEFPLSYLLYDQSEITRAEVHLTSSRTRKSKMPNP